MLVQFIEMEATCQLLNLFVFLCTLFSVLKKEPKWDVVLLGLGATLASRLFMMLLNIKLEILTLNSIILFATSMTTSFIAFQVNRKNNMLAMVSTVKVASLVLETSMAHGSSVAVCLLQLSVYFYLSYALCTSELKHQILLHARETLQLNAFRIVNEWKNEGGDFNGFYSAEGMQTIQQMSKGFYFDTSKSFFSIRAVLRIAGFPIFSLIMAGFIVQIALYCRFKIYSHILAAFALDNTSASSAHIVGLAFVWACLFLVEPAKSYIMQRTSALKEIIVALMTTKIGTLFSTYNSSDLNPRLAHTTQGRNMQEFSSALENLINICTMTIFQMFNIVIVSRRIGWLSLIPISFTTIHTTLLNMTRMHIQMQSINRANCKKPDFHKEVDSVIKHMRAIKIYGLEYIFDLEPFCMYVSQQSSMFMAAINFMLDVLNVIGSQITSILAFSLAMDSGDEMTYVEVAMTINALDSLIAYTKCFASVSRSISQIRELEEIIMTVIGCSNTKYITRKNSNCVIQSDNNKATAAIIMDNCKFAWNKTKFVMPPISLTINKSEFITVVGKVGSGKSSLLSAICAEMPLLGGNGCVYGSIGYVSQRPWIMNATFRDNVLLGSPFDQDLYGKVINACALNEDLDQLPAGDMTEIGKQGINISGGQKARLALARALYSQADIYVLDDILSAVDANVERHLIENLFSKDGMLRSKTCILVTHAHYILPLSNRTIYMQDGKMGFKAQENIGFENMKIVPKSEQVTFSMKDSRYSAEAGKFTINPELEGSKFKDNLLLRLFKISGYFNVAVSIGFQLFSAYLIYFIENKRMDLIAKNSQTMSLSALQSFLLLNAIVNVAQLLINSLSSLVCKRFWSDSATKNLQDTLIKTLLFTSLPEYERLSSSTIMQILKLDIFYLASVLPEALCNHGLKAFRAFYTLLQILKRSPYVLVLALPIIVALKRFSSQLTKATDRLQNAVIHSKKNLGLVSSEMNHGGEILRIHRRLEYFSDKLLQTHVLSLYVERAFKQVKNIQSFVNQVSGELLQLVTLACTIWIHSRKPEAIGPGDVDLLINFCSKVLKEIPALKFDSSELDAHMPYLLRFFTYAETLKQEAPHFIDETKPPLSWPSGGHIEFKSYQMRYREGLDIVLKGVSFEIEARQKIGVVGRTGAGKSSLTYALMRIVEPAAGTISIDGIDITTIGLSTLRSQISIVPQDPVLFEGTIRDNLDPKREFTDDEIWTAVNKAHIGDLLETPTAEHVPSSGNSKAAFAATTGPWVKKVGLEKWVYADGKNFSVGQRQLISLCRALLWQRPILILDEATANIDMATDKIMQQVVQTEFQSSTVITIAHRLDTVMNSDKILVIDNGKVAEYDAPSNLLAQRDSQFAKLLENMNFNKSNAQ